MKPPEIDPGSPGSGSQGQKITINGKYFGSTRGRVMVGKKPCHVTEWTMDSLTGVSTIELIVPKNLKKGTYDLKVINMVGEDKASFIID